MIYLQLFLSFLKIGAFSFGGGYGMIALIRETVLSNGWLTEEEFLSFIAVAESTPGPIAVNIATFIGSSQAGVIGALIAILGVILPSFIIILIIASIIKNLLKLAAVRSVLSGIRPAIVGMIIATAIIMFLSKFFDIKTIGSNTEFDYKGLILFVVLCMLSLVFYKLKKRTPSPILLILLSAVFGMVVYPF